MTATTEDPFAHPGQQGDDAGAEQQPNDATTGEQSTLTTGTQADPYSEDGGEDDPYADDDTADLRARYLEKGDRADLLEILDRATGGGR